MKKIYYLFVLLLVVVTSVAQSYSVESPNGKNHLDFELDASGTPTYSVRVVGFDETVIAPSKLGFVEKNGRNLSSGFHVDDCVFNQVDSIWHQPWGENKTIRENYKEMQVFLRNDDNVLLVLTFRLFNDGLGFRYAYDVTGADSLLLMDELTEFNFASDGDSWSIWAEFNTYEFLYHKLRLSALDNANTPMTFKLDNGIYGSIHEAALTDFPEMTLYAHEPGGLHAVLAPWPDGVRARFAGGHFQTPWRTIQLGYKAVDLINSSLILNLNEPCAIEGDLSWIKPMKYVGIWWGMHLGIQSWTMDSRHGATTENALRYIDFAADNNVDAVLFEGWNEGWESWGGRQNFDFTKPYADFDLEKILDYARKKNVAVISHHETGGNVYNYERQLDRAYQWLDSLGVHAVKTGYAGGIPDGHNHHGQFNVNHYRRVVQTAAKYHCMLDVHEPIKPTGIRRTYPNMMTREGVRGMEWNAWSSGNPPQHQVTLPFTRMLAGPLDYTPGTFDILFDSTRNSPLYQRWNDNDQGNSRVHTTLAKQLADWVILYSPLQMASDMIEHYQNHPAFQFFRDYNPDCDWSEALLGEVGEYVAIARRAGNTFFLGAATDEEPRELTVPLNFLPAGYRFVATVYADDIDAHWKNNPTAYRIYNVDNLDDKQSLQLRLAPGGGCAVVLKMTSN